MFDGAVFSDVVLMLFCYFYVLLMIFVSTKMNELLRISPKASRKFLHAMIGNLPFVIPFFKSSIYAVLVAAPFIFVTYLASPHSPFKNIGKAMKGLVDITEQGHSWGLFFYAVSYTGLALLFTSKPIVIAAGILPMAYGDSAASVVGERYGRIRYKIVADKSLEGSAAMFFGSFLSLAVSLIFFSLLYSFPVFEKILAALATATVATFVEGFSPMGFDNLSVPAFSALAFLLSSGGM